MLRIKRVHSPDLRDEVYALRYRAYRHEGALDKIISERFEDCYDSQPNQMLWALTEHDDVVGSIRTTWFNPLEPQWRIPEMDGYADDVARHVPEGKRIFSGSRFVVDPQREGRSALFAMTLLRFHVMTFRACGCEWALAAVRRNHLPFYRRVLRLQQVSEGRLYPGLKSTMFLTACDFKQNIEAVYHRTAELRPKGYERVFVDDNYRDVWEFGLPVDS